MVNRIVTGAHYGLRDWLAQRITAAVMLLYVLMLGAYLLWQRRLDYDAWTALFSSDVVRSFTLLFLLSLYYHAWIGMRDIVMDYLKPAWLRLLIHVGVIMALLLYAIWAVQILWGM
ncbi:MAG TPA: succinate dehydrogenase, hydrophobic membrane anchor protein [Gallionellaceae bacterium]